ncbi:MAG: serine/threonine protein kinase [Deltaproteobacteria bacterium]|nr:serine/threonine protein kinase [Deltaproteobacteria bacterium]
MRRPEKAVAGQIIAGRWRLERTLGAGGVGAVFAATPLEGGPMVAIKTLLPDAAGDDDTVRRFQREARTAGAVGRDGVVAVHEFGMDPVAGPFMVMELLEGEPLSSRLHRAAPTLQESVTWMAQILDTLSAVHERGIVHRDLKPGNVFLVPPPFDDRVTPLAATERVKILDFGLSHVPSTSGQTKLTLPGEVLGTPRYMSPEQALGDPIDARSDLYSVGILLYACLLGQPPYHDVPVTRVLKAVIDGPPTSLRTLRPGLPEALYDVLDRALARDRDQRFTSAAEMRAALLASLAPPVARPPPALHAVKSSGFPVVLVALALVVVGLGLVTCVAAGAASVWLRARATASSPR